MLNKDAPWLVPIYATIAFLVEIVVYFYVLPESQSHRLQSSLAETESLIFFHFLALYSSIVVYRVFFHPLRRYPGPILARITNFWHVYKCLDAKNHLLLEKLHEQYGPIVRVGPQELSIVSPDIHLAMSGARTKCTKAALYDLTLPSRGLNVTRNTSEHDRRKKVWDPGFTASVALESYHGRIVFYGDQLLQYLQSKQNQPIDVRECFYWFAFDIMGDLALGRSFNMLRNGQWHNVLATMRKGMSMLGPLTPVPWLARVGMAIPGAMKDWNNMCKWCEERMRERLQMGVKELDISHWLIEGSRNGNGDYDWDWLSGDALSIITAGSDTVATTLVFAFYVLALYPEEQRKLRRSLPPAVDIGSQEKLAQMAHLNAFLNEVLRLYPAVPSGGYRIVGEQGLPIASLNTIIPPETIITGPRWSISRLESCFEQAHDFIPDRWTTRAHMVKDKRAFVPFNQGRYSCIGKNLAWIELRHILALLVSRFEVTFGPGEDGSRFLADMKDTFAAAPGMCSLVFKDIGSSV
ncbi:cytochrome P450 monooxygenase-like protein [Pseudovirgaria hyperparasitica]|uniref:Cytochrome P450 monooxygenase-like protein n=1 Tax=Pseudovirgaria hyperparasitica TaxID=470096 RepID=A0A6A6WDF1_9PEZI|nr:cytochrome P450 monooxygenase-like protein [Pseudovirgaria hyperparasitica]KAF2759886.1 cytochrome P450 monooxygenase-like protein [Pseudovirgaria hyperparasitica]